MKHCDISICQAACCGPVPIPEGYLEIFKDRIREDSTIIDSGIPNHKIVIDPDTLRCGFMNKDLRCSIYDNRPDICRMFGDTRETHPMLKCHYLGQIDAEEAERMVGERLGKMKGIM